MKEVIICMNGFSFLDKLRVLFTVIKLPAALFHELCHWFVAIILFLKIAEIKCDYFYKVESNMIYSYSFHVPVSFEEKKINRLKALIVCVAPILGVLLLLYFVPVSIFYIVISWQTFNLSKGDMKNIKENINKLTQ